MGKKRVITEEEIKHLVLPAPGELLWPTVRLLGYDRILVKCADGHSRLCRIRDKMKRRVWIRVGDTVLVAPWDFQYETMGDIVWRYTRSQTEELRRRSLLNI